MVVLAATASLAFPGTGQALNGRLRPAVIWAAAGVVPMVLSLLWMPLLALSLVVRIGSAVDAGWRARANPGTRNGVLAMCVAGGTVAAHIALRLFVMEGFRVPQGSMTPTLQVGDHFFVNKLARGDRGDIVVFWHPTGTTFVKRIVAIGGDTVAITDGVLHVNGADAPRRAIGPATYVEADPGADATVSRVDEYEETLGGHSYRIYLAARPAGAELAGRSTRDHDFPRTRDGFFNDAGEPCARRPMMAETEAPDARPQMRLSADGTACVVPAGTVFLLGDNRDNSNDSRFWGVISVDKIVGEVTGIWWSKGLAGVAWARLGGVD